MKRLLQGCAIAALAVTAAHAQETTSSIKGTITSNGAPISNATVTITHVPTGTRSVTVTDARGSYVATGLRPGGPYIVGVKAPGYADAQVTDISVAAAQSFELPVDLKSEGQEIIVTATQVRGAKLIGQGPATILGAANIANIASVNRDIRDLERRDPFARLDDTPSGGRVVSFAGQNARFNRFTVDGVPITDNVGINGDGLPSRRSPIPFDAIGQFQAKVAPYDVREGNFQGGVVNLILKSGTNEFHGTGFYARSGDQFVGDQTGNLKITNPHFKVENYGVELSGPIVKDKIFFMVAGERLRGGLPLAEGSAEDNVGIAIPGLTQAMVDRVIAIAKSKYNYDPGNVLHESGDKDDRVVAKLDANLSDSQRLSLTYTHANDAINNNTSNTFTTPPTGLGLASNAYVLGNRLHTGVLQLNSQWSDEFSTEVRGFYKNYTRIQTPLLGNNFAQFKICATENSDRGGGSATGTTESTGCAVGVPTISIGPDNSRQTNQLHSETWGGLVQARLTRNDHDLRVFGEYQRVSVFDAFLQNSAGNYYFDSFTDFQNGNAQSLTYANALPSLDPNDAAANIQYQTYTFGVMDSWHVSSDLNVSYGMRYDMYGSGSLVPFSPAFFARYGFTNTASIKGRGVFQPRFSFDYKATPRLSINGGAGIFAGGTPDIYAANSYLTNGVLSNSITIREQNGGAFTGGSNIGFDQSVGAAALTNVTGRSIPNLVNGYLIASAPINSPLNTASVNALDHNFKIPSQWRVTLSTNYKADLGPLGDGWNLGVDLFFSKVRNQVYFTDIRSIASPGNLTPDGRQRYVPATRNTDGTLNFGDSNSDILLTNTHKGRSYVAVARVDKTWDFGLNFYGSFTWESIKDQAPATSSTASSNYLNGAFLDPNNVQYGISNDQIKYQFKYGLTFDHAFFGDNKTTIALFGESRIGHPYSFTFQDPASGRSAVFGTSGSGTTGTSGSRYLLYVPTLGGDPRVVYDSPATQAAFENFIRANGLSKYQGQVAPRNGFTSPWFTRLDLHLAQELPTGLGRSKLTLFADIENFTNLLNKNWGQISEYAFPYTVAPVRVQCVTTGGTIAANAGQPCVQYRYSPAITSNGQFVAPTQTLYTRQSLYTIRIGARFTF